MNQKRRVCIKILIAVLFISVKCEDTDNEGKETQNCEMEYYCECKQMDIYHEGECKSCEVEKCFICNVKDPNKCDSCLPGFELSEDFSQCGRDGCFGNPITCPCDALDVFIEGECVPCQVENCFLCNIKSPNKCDSCLPGSEMNEDFTQCVGEEGEKEDEEDEEKDDECDEHSINCPCDAFEVLFEGECTSCGVPDCFLCSINDPNKCDSCLPGFELSEDFSQCGRDGCFGNPITCPCDALDVFIEGECVPCQVENCFLCNIKSPNKCDSCLPGSEMNEDFTQCVGEEGEKEDEEDEEKDDECDEHSINCPCDAFEVLFEGECTSCGVPDCFLCSINDPNKCDSCLPGFELSEDFSQCGRDGCFGNPITCPCDALDVFIEGECVPCQVENCFLCNIKSPNKCDSCLPGSEMNEDFTQCVGEEGEKEDEEDEEKDDECDEHSINCPCDAFEVLFEGECTSCGVPDCFLCSINDPNKCDSCLPGFELSEDFSQCGRDGCFGNPITCPCDALDVFIEGECVPCQVENCFLCNIKSPNKCDSCLPGSEMNEDFTQCVGEEGEKEDEEDEEKDDECDEHSINCPCDAFEVLFEGECTSCGVPDCFLCSINDPNKCDSCLPGFELSEDFSQCGRDGCFGNPITCPCDALDVFIEGECVPCQVENCFLCNIKSPNKCDSCLPGSEMNEDFTQCVGEEGEKEDEEDEEKDDECDEHSINCPCDAFEVLFEGECTSCGVPDCFLCSINDPNKCDSCLPGFELSEDFSQCRTDDQFSPQDPTCDDLQITCSCDTFQVKQNNLCVPCQVENCFLCTYNNKNSCDICYPTYTLSDNHQACSPHSPVIQPCSVASCLQCVSNEEHKCEVCQDGFELNPQTFSCDIPPCPDYLLFDGSSCNCTKKFYHDEQNKQCVACIENCAFCSSIYCDQCFKGYYYHEGSNACKVCSDHCLECTTANGCDSCESGYQYSEERETCEMLSGGVSGVVSVGGQQVQCIGGCAKCSTVDTCDVCQTGYHLSDSTCLSCHPTCQTCNGQSNTNCTDCYTNFVLDNNKCVTCEDNKCLACTSASYCTDCVIGFYSQAGTCTQCLDFCLQCADGQTCQRCDSGYVYLKGIGSVDGVACIECPEGCSLCDESDIGVCRECSQGYYNQTNTGKCETCPEGCQTCTSATICTSCSSGYRQVGNNCLQACQFPCAACKDTDPSACTDCYGGYALDGNECIEDLSCNSYNNCTACPRTYTLNQQQCLSCNAGSNCVKCSSTDITKCTQCQMGYFLQNESCTQCPSSCTACFSDSYCTFCRDGFYMGKFLGLPTGKCESCSEEDFCSTCRDAPSRCTSCIDDYTLIGFKCRSDEGVGLDMQIDVDYRQFILNINRFKLELLEMLGDKFEGKLKLLTILSIKEGSVDIEAALTVPEDSTAEDSYNTLSEFFEEGETTLGGMTLTSTVKAEGFTPDDDGGDDNKPGEKEKENNLGLALALGIGIPLLIVVIIIIGIITSKKRKDTPEQHYKIAKGTDTDLVSV